MKFCSKCGKELSDEAVVCMGCGCAVDSRAPQISAPKKQLGKKQITLIIIAAVALVALIVVGFFLWRFLKIEQVKKDLAGNEYTYYYSSTFSYREYSYAFDEDANCTHYYYFANIDAENEYEKDYKIELKNGKIFLVFPSDTLEVQYNDYGKIKQLYDINTDEVYD